MITPAQRQSIEDVLHGKWVLGYRLERRPAAGAGDEGEPVVANFACVRRAYYTTFEWLTEAELAGRQQGERAMMNLLETTQLKPL